MNILKTKIDWSVVFSFKNIIFLFVVYTSLYHIFSFSVGGGGLDISWNYGLNWAIKNKLVFGKEVVFTFGPLAYLETRFLLYMNQMVFLVFTVIFVLNLNYIAYITLSKYTKKIPQLIIVFIFGSLFQAALGISQLILPITLFFIYSYFESPKKIYLLCALFWSVLIFYIKLNSGIIISFFFFSSLVYFLVTKRIQVYFLLLLGVLYALSVYVLSYFLHVDIPNYVINAVEIINGYNYAMVTVPFSGSYFPLIITLLLPLIYIAFNPKKFFFNTDNFFKLILMGGAIFITFKYGFVRADGHQLTFYQNTAFLMILFFCFFDIKFNIKTVSIVLLPTVLVFVLHQFLPVGFPIRITQFPWFYYDTVTSMTDDGTRKLPVSVLDTIGKGTVDIIPTEITLIPYNNLNYSPRPIFQSYSVYTPALDSINHHFFLGKKAPDYVIFSVGTIDFRHVFWDESFTKLALYTNYKQVSAYCLPAYSKAQGIHGANIKDSIDLILLQKREKSLKISEKVILDTIVDIDSTVYLKKSNSIQYLYADIQYNLRGKLESFLYQPTMPRLKLTYTDASSMVIREPALILKNGVLINKRVESNAEACYVFSQEYQKLLDVTAFRFEQTSKSFQKYIHIKIKEFTFN